MFMDGRISMGVGLSNVQFRDSVSSCGRCLIIHQSDNFASIDYELSSWNVSSEKTNKTSHIAMVFDQCADPICTDGFLDFDIYSVDQPVRYDNPKNVLWEFVACPVLPHESIELLICLSTTCKAQDVTPDTIEHALYASSPYYWSLYIRNARLPIKTVYIPEYKYFLKDQNGWVFDSFFDFYSPFTIQLDSLAPILINLSDYKPDMDYHGGLLIPTNVQN
jgi:hypothetical protein